MKHCSLIGGLILALAALPLFLTGQAEGDVTARVLDEARWQELTEPLHYSIRQPADAKKKKQDDENKDAKKGRKKGNAPAAGPARQVMKVLIIVLGAVALALLIGGLLGYGLPRNKKIRPQEAFTFEKLREDLLEADLQAPIKRALEQGDFALAIRLYYLELLQHLSRRQLIRWKKDKTNLAYLSEIQGHPAYETFRECTRIFERIHYGNHPIDRPTFHAFAPVFRAALDAAAPLPQQNDRS